MPRLGYNRRSMEDALFHIGPLLAIALLGLVAGVLGGLLGVGGSVIMIPGLVLLFGHGRFEGLNQHAYQAAAMIANVAVALPAVMRHHKAGAVALPVLKWMMPAAAVAVIVGVWLSNRPMFAGAGGGVWLGRILAIFLLYEVILNLRKVLGPREATLQAMEGARITRPRAATAGGSMGLIGGLLGVGGGVIAVPIQQLLLALPLRTAIANSAAVMVLSAAIGATYKNATLSQHEVPWYAGLLLAALLAPTCVIGGRLGASLTHSLPIRQVRFVFIVIMSLAAWRMAALPWPTL
ncbi:TSUP family transporter [Phycisphaerales bacterium AB-hyl4]|uniref:Probable membrane transporter protein n=1 Tax=Natronomicrosphaera hydrolytica TaxID=3242702 RepID=A0ABV4U650_9BACT